MSRIHSCKRARRRNKASGGENVCGATAGGDPGGRPPWSLRRKDHATARRPEKVGAPLSCAPSRSRAYMTVIEYHSRPPGAILAPPYRTLATIWFGRSRRPRSKRLAEPPAFGEICRSPSGRTRTPTRPPFTGPKVPGVQRVTPPPGTVTCKEKIAAALSLRTKKAQYGSIFTYMWSPVECR
jgi:hypothetical protein